MDSPSHASQEGSWFLAWFITVTESDLQNLLDDKDALRNTKRRLREKKSEGKLTLAEVLRICFAVSRKQSFLRAF